MHTDAVGHLVAPKSDEGEKKAQRAQKNSPSPRWGEGRGEVLFNR
jgi:hypothetical protein